MGKTNLHKLYTLLEKSSSQQSEKGCCFFRAYLSITIFSDISKTSEKMILGAEIISIKGSIFCIEKWIVIITNFVLNFIDSKNTTRGSCFILGEKGLFGI